MGPANRRQPAPTMTNSYGVTTPGPFNQSGKCNRRLEITNSEAASGPHPRGHRGIMGFSNSRIRVVGFPDWCQSEVEPDLHDDLFDGSGRESCSRSPRAVGCRCGGLGAHSGGGWTWPTSHRQTCRISSSTAMPCGRACSTTEPDPLTSVMLSHFPTSGDGLERQYQSRQFPGFRSDQRQHAKHDRLVGRAIHERNALC